MASAFPPRCRSSGPRAFVGLGPLQEGLLCLVETYVEALPPNAGFALQNAGAFDLGNLPRYRALSLGNLPRHRARNPFPQPHELATLAMHELQPPRLAFATLIEAVTASCHQSSSFPRPTLPVAVSVPVAPGCGRRRQCGG